MSTKRRSKGTHEGVTAQSTKPEASLDASPKRRARKSSAPPPAEAKPRGRRVKRVNADGEVVETTSLPPPAVELSETPAELRAGLGPVPNPVLDDLQPAPAPEPTPAPAFAKAEAEAREDEISVPPVASDLDEAFFESQPPPPSARVPAELEASRDVRMEQLASPAARARRAQLAKYVKGVVGVSLAVCFLAFIRLAIHRNHSSAETSALAATQSPAALAAPVPNPTQAAAEPAAQPATIAAPADLPVAAPAPAPEPTPAPEATAPAAAPEEPVQADPARAKKEKRESQLALERGKTDESIEHGELAVKLDPTDGEAWLILGAAYQAKGNWTDARRCYKSCMTEGKRGPRGECSAMLR